MLDALAKMFSGGGQSLEQRMNSPLYQMGQAMVQADGKSPLQTNAGDIYRQNQQQRFQNDIVNRRYEAEQQQKQQLDLARNATYRRLVAQAPDLAAMVKDGSINPLQASQELWSRQRDAKKSGAGNKPFSTVGKIMTDFNNGLIDETTRDALITKQAASDGMEIISDGEGGFTMRQGAGVGTGKPMKEGQAKANIYASRMENSNAILTEFETEGTDLWNHTVSGVPGIGNYMVSDDYRQYEQAKRDFVNATLRQESGAVINPDEFANAERQYFPQPGDDEQTIAQKRRNRQIAMQAIRQASGQPATNPEPLQSAPSQPNVTSTGTQWRIK